MNEEQKQDEIKKIVSVCKKYNIKYDVSKLDFIEKDTGQEVDFNSYTLFVVKNSLNLEIYSFVSVKKIECYFSKFAKHKNTRVFFHRDELIDTSL